MQAAFAGGLRGSGWHICFPDSRNKSGRRKKSAQRGPSTADRRTSPKKSGREKNQERRARQRPPAFSRRKCKFRRRPRTTNSRQIRTNLPEKKKAALKARTPEPRDRSLSMQPGDTSPKTLPPGLTVSQLINCTIEEELRRIIRDAGFRPAQRDALYRTCFLNWCHALGPIRQRLDFFPDPAHDPSRDRGAESFCV